MTKRIVFDANNQDEIAAAAGQLVLNLEPTLPRVPWLSYTGQQDSFQKIVELIVKSVGQLNADDNAKEAATFWALFVLYCRKRGFRMAMANVKNRGGVWLSPIVTAFVQWAGSNTHPAQAIAADILGRKEKELLASGMPQKIHNKIVEISLTKKISMEAASTHFQELFEKACKKYMVAGLSEYEADQKAIDEILGLEITE